MFKRFSKGCYSFRHFLLWSIIISYYRYSSISNLFLQAASQWEEIGEVLMIPSGILEAIEHDYPKANDAILAVFTAWRRHNCSPYSWKMILKALATPHVGHRRLANEIASRLSGELSECVLCSTLSPFQFGAFLNVL